MPSTLPVPVPRAPQALVPADRDTVSRDGRARCGDNGEVTAAVPAASARGPGMRSATARQVVAVATSVAVVGLVAAGGVLLALGTAAGATAVDHEFWPMQLVAALAYGSAGAWLSAQGRAGALGPVFLFVAVSYALSLAGRAYGVHGLQVVDGLPADEWLLWMSTWVWVPGHLTLFLVVPHLLPDGSVVRGWGPAVAVSAAALVTNGAVWAVEPYSGSLLDAEGVGPNPVALIGPVRALLDGVAMVLLLVAAVLVLVGVRARLRRTGPADRESAGWVLFGAAVSGVLVALAAVLEIAPLAAVAVAVLPACCLVALTRHRLWDLQLVVRRSLLYGGLTVAVGVTYAGVIGLVGGAVGAATGAPIVATAAVAMLVLPLHHVLRRTVNRLVHGQAEDPIRTTARLAQRLGSAVAPQELTADVLPTTIAEVRRALRLVHLSLTTDDGRTFTTGQRAAGAVELPLVHAGEHLGVLRAVAGRGGPTASEQRALEDFAAQAAVAVHGVRLADELQRERERAVGVREEERRHLRRLLHDGVGATLAAAALQAETARHVVDVDPARGRDALDRLVGLLHGAVDDVRMVTRGLRPPTLDELGLAGALAELGARSSTAGLTVEVRVGELGEVPAAVEVATYLVAAELIANACRHSGGARVRLLVHREGEDLLLSVSDDGRGFPADAVPGVGTASVRRRVDEIGGEIDLDTGQRGTVVRVRAPLVPA